MEEPQRLHPKRQVQAQLPEYESEIKSFKQEHPEASKLTAVFNQQINNQQIFPL